MTIANRMSSTAIAAILTLPLTLAPASAQDAQSTDPSGGGSGQQAQQMDQTQGSGQSTEQNQASQQNQSAQQGQTAQQGQQQSSGEMAGMPGDGSANALIATVGGTEIRGSDLMTVIGALPPQLRSQPPQMLVPIALEQLIMRELILERARSENLSQDPEVTALVTGATQAAEDDAMVQVWLDRELAKSVTDESVQQSYDQAQAQGQQNLPPLEEVRPQIEQHLRRQAVEDLRTSLREGAEIVLYDPAGRPLDNSQQGTASGGSGGQGQMEAETSSSSADGNEGASNMGGQSADSEAARTQAEQAGMQQVEAMEGTTILRGKSANNADVYMIVGPSGELLAIAAPLPGSSGSGSSEDGSADQKSSDIASEAGEPAESGFMATQAQPATPNMWDPAAVEHGMRQLELGIRGAAGEISNP